VPSTILAQGLEIGIGGGMTSSLDDDFKNGELGGLVGGFILIGDGPAKAGLEVDYGRFQVVSEHFNQIDILGSARYVVPGSLSRLFLGAKAGYLTHFAEVENVDTQVSGIGYGPTLGLRGDGPGRVFELECSVLRLNYGNVSLDGEEVSKTRTDAWKIYMKFNLNIPVNRG